jgi:hypothetical protein
VDHQPRNRHLSGERKSERLTPYAFKQVMCRDMFRIEQCDVWISPFVPSPFPGKSAKKFLVKAIDNCLESVTFHESNEVLLLTGVIEARERVHSSRKLPILLVKFASARLEPVTLRQGDYSWSHHR